MSDSRDLLDLERLLIHFVLSNKLHVCVQEPYRLSPVLSSDLIQLLLIYIVHYSIDVNESRCI